ncbi:MAG: hypothetical protein MZU97_25125 [Bacillus subtilis]|nr:hypothetical protein [Bacillus subtilis]
MPKSGRGSGWRRMGAKRLSDEELLALLLRTGTKKESVIELAKNLLYTAPGLAALGAKTLSELAALPGIGVAKASIMLAAIELGKRMYLPITRPDG